MKTASVAEFRAGVAQYLEQEDPVIVTRHGKPQGVYVPLALLPALGDRIRAFVAEVTGEILSRQLEQQGATDEEIDGEFRKLRADRRKTKGSRS